MLVWVIGCGYLLDRRYRRGGMVVVVTFFGGKRGRGRFAEFKFRVSIRYVCDFVFLRLGMFSK